MSRNSAHALTRSRRTEARGAASARINERVSDDAQAPISPVRAFFSRFWLLLCSLIVSFLAYGEMMIKVNGSIPTKSITLLAINGALIIALEIAVAIRLPRSNRIILPSAVLLNFIGITEITRIDYERTKMGFTSDIGSRQQIWFAAALVVSILFIIFLRDYRSLRRISYVCMVIGILLLLSPMVPGLGKEINGSRVWIGIGPFSMQPGEFARIFLAIFFAAYLFDHRDRLSVGGKKALGIHWPRLKDFGPIIVVWAASIGILVIQHDLGTSLMLFAMFVGMLYVATDRPSWLLIGSVGFGFAVVAADKLFSNFANRVEIWQHPFSQAIYDRAYGGSYQVVQGLFGMATGGVWGTGFGEGHPAITPFANSDFIYASLGEETGLVVEIAILLMYLLIIGSGFIAAMRCSDGFGKLLSSGLSFSMAFQIFTVVGGITLVIPLTGLTLPFIAAGGSSLVANWTLIIFILIISNAANSPQSTSLEDTQLQMEAVRALKEQAAASQQAREEQQRRAEKRRRAKTKHGSAANDAAASAEASGEQKITPETQPEQKPADAPGNAAPENNKADNADNKAANTTNAPGITSEETQAMNPLEMPSKSEQEGGAR